MRRVSQSACAELRASGLPERLMIDASHANSQKDHANQIKVCASIGQQLAAGESRIIGVMIESHLICRPAGLGRRQAAELRSVDYRRLHWMG